MPNIINREKERRKKDCWIDKKEREEKERDTNRLLEVIREPCKKSDREKKSGDSTSTKTWNLVVKFRTICTKTNNSELLKVAK